MEKFLPAGTELKSHNGSYRIEEVLGSGGFGITYRATNKVKLGNITTAVSVAIKEHFIAADCQRDTDSRVVYSKPAADRVERARKDFMTEARRLGEVGNCHPNIVKVNEVFEANNTAYYVMEYLDGDTLRKYVEKRGRLSEAETLAMLQPVIEAIGTLHSQQITHLDIKPDNIMLRHADDGSLQPVLIDFGLSKHYDEEGNPTSTINVAGYSPGYAPLEQMLAGGVKQFSPVTDIYSLAATMFFCLNGKAPKEPETDEDSPINGLVESLCSAGTASALLAATQSKRNLRPQSALALLESLGLSPGEEFLNAISGKAAEVVTDDVDIVLKDPGDRDQNKQKSEKSDETVIKEEKKDKVGGDDTVLKDVDKKEDTNKKEKEEKIAEAKKKKEVKKPETPHDPKPRSFLKVLIWIIILAAVAVGGYFAYDKIQSSTGSEEEQGTVINGGGKFTPDSN